MAILISSLQMTDEFLNFGEKAHERDDGTGNIRLKMSAVQLGNDQHDRMTAPYGLSRPYGDEDPSKRNLELIVHDPEMLNKFRELDAHIPTVYEDKSRSWFKKTKKLEYKPLLKETEHGTVVTVKVYCPEHKNSTKIKELVEDGNKAVEGSIEALNPGSECLVLIKPDSLWYNKDKYGVALVAKTIIVKRGAQRSYGLEDMILAPGLDWE